MLAELNCAAIADETERFYGGPKKLLAENTDAPPARRRPTTKHGRNRRRPGGPFVQSFAHGAKPGHPGKQILAGPGRAVTFIVLWLTEARRNYFRS